MTERYVSGLKFCFNNCKDSDLEKACEDLETNFNFIGKGEFEFFKNGHYQIKPKSNSFIRIIQQKQDSTGRIIEINERKIDFKTDYGNYTFNF